MSGKGFSFITMALLLMMCREVNSQKNERRDAWVSDQGNGYYINPVIHSDFSDPDAIRVDSDYYMTASSFNCVPGLPVLHSRDLVNWELISYALPKLVPEEEFNKVQHGNGVWAPSIRYHNGEFYIIYPDPDHGIYMVKAADPRGQWSEPKLIKEGKGFIDPSPLWDDNGKAYLVYAFAGSRAGIKSVIVVCTLEPDASKAFNDEVVVFDGHDKNNTVEGPKFYKRNSYYYIFAPAGGVVPGWQLAMRSKNVLGPYEAKVVMAQGKSLINGPHQGAWVTTVTGEDWFLNFQDKGAYGRVLHLNPMVWKNDWPVIGSDNDGDGTGEPVSGYKMPGVGKKYPVMAPPTSDEFNSSSTGLQWQWHANKQVTWGFPSGNLGFFRLNCIPVPEGYRNLWDVPNLFLQKFPAEEFTAESKFTFNTGYDNERAGFLIMGADYASASVRRDSGKLVLEYRICTSADKGKPETVVERVPLGSGTIYIRTNVGKGAVCRFAYSTDGVIYHDFSKPFTAKAGRWIGAKLGFFAVRDGFINDAGYADLDWIRITKP